MHELDRRIGLLRLLVADVVSREQQRNELLRQYATQRRRIVEATVHQAGDISQALLALREVEERLLEVEQSGKHLEMIRIRAATELEALLLTKRVAEAKAQLADLESRQLRLTQQLAVLSPEPQPPSEEMIIVAEFTLDDHGSEVEMSHEELHLRELNDEVQREIGRLHKLIHDASQRAARSITIPITERSEKGEAGGDDRR